jgi:hypothetical protein
MNMVAYNTNTQGTTLPHELRHWAFNSLPEAMKNAVSHVYGGFEQAFPKYTEGLKKNAQYANKGPVKTGDEIFAREADKVLGRSDYGGNPALNYVQDRAMRALQPQMLQDAKRVGVSNIPIALNMLRELLGVGGEQ